MTPYERFMIGRIRQRRQFHRSAILRAIHYHPSEKSQWIAHARNHRAEAHELIVKVKEYRNARLVP